MKLSTYCFYLLAFSFCHTEVLQAGQHDQTKSGPPLRYSPASNNKVCESDQLISRLAELVIDGVCNLARQLNCLTITASSDALCHEAEGLIINPQGLQPEEPPPPYDSIDIRGHLRNMNPELWQRLQFDLLPSISSPQHIAHSSACYTVTVHSLRETLVRQTEIRPALDVFLQDWDGKSFSLSELPLEWLRIPELVRHITSIHPHNTRAALDQAKNALPLVRELFILLVQSERNNNTRLTELLQQCSSLGVDLESFRDCHDQSIVDIATSKDPEGEKTSLLVKSGAAQINEQHWRKVIEEAPKCFGHRDKIGKTASKIQALHRAQRKSRSPYQLNREKTAHGNLLKLALKKGMDYSTIFHIMDAAAHQDKASGVVPVGAKPDMEDAITALQLELFDSSRCFVLNQIMKFLPENSFADMGQWRDKKTGMSLLDYFLKTDSPLNCINRFHLLGLPWNLDDLPQIFDARESISQYDMITIMGRYISSIGEQDSRLLSQWRSSDGHTITGLARSKGVSPNVIAWIETYIEMYSKDAGQDAGQDKESTKKTAESTTGKSHTKPDQNSGNNWQVLYINQILQSAQSAQSAPSAPSTQQIINPENYQQELLSLLQSSGLQPGYIPSYGFCFYYAISQLFHINIHQLITNLGNLLEQALSALNDESAIWPVNLHTLLTNIGIQGIQEALQNLQDLSWGELSWFPAVAQVLNNLVDDFHGVQVITPDTNDLSLPLITLFHADGTPQQITNLIPGIPVILHNGGIHRRAHWTFAETAGAGHAETSQNRTGSPASQPLSLLHFSTRLFPEK